MAGGEAGFNPLLYRDLLPKVNASVRGELQVKLSSTRNWPEIVKALGEVDPNHLYDLAFLIAKSRVEDLDAYNASMLLENIEFVVRARGRFKYEVPFGEPYLWWILPLRIWRERLEFWRGALFEAAAPVVDGVEDVDEAVRRIASWVKGFMRFEAPRIRTRRPLDIFQDKRGKCGEYGILFTAIARSAGIPARYVVNPGEDHAWSEVWVKGSWLHVDPTLDPPGNFNNPRIYERDWGKDISYVLALRFDGVEVDVTQRYTDVGELIVDVGVPKARVVLLSHWLGDHSKDYKGVYEKACEARTSERGLAVFKIGGGKYTIIVEYDGRVSGKVATVEENKSTLIEF